FVPALRLFEQATMYQRLSDTLIERLNTPGPHAHSAQQLELIECRKNITGPSIPGLGIGFEGRTLHLHHLQIVRVSLRMRLATASPIYQPSLQRTLLLTS